MRKHAASRHNKWIVLAGALLLAALPAICMWPPPLLAQEKTEQNQASAEMPNSSCIDCHNPDMLKMSKEELADQVLVGEKPAPPKTKAPYVTGELNLSILEQKYAEGAHADITCVSCHKGISEVPHQQRLGTVDCKECHDEAVESIEKSAHGLKATKKVGCVGCHDVHYGKGQASSSPDFAKNACKACHSAYGLDTERQHKSLYDAPLHLKLDCMLCHAGKTAGVHNIPSAKAKTSSCESCHSAKTVLSKAKPVSAGITYPQFINLDVVQKFGYVVGANRIPLLDTILVLAILGTFALPVFHGGLRFITRRKEPLHLPEDKIYLHPLIERIWHWVQALAIIMLLITGAMIHWPENFGSFDWAVRWHNNFGWIAVIGFVVWLLFNLVTGRIKHYIPTGRDIPKGMIKQAQFYGYGIFKHEPHPYAPSEDNKFNPLQKFAYLQFQVMLLPILLVSGILYMYPDSFRGVINAIGGMAVLGLIHTILGALFGAFLVAHLYLATTGETIGENFKAIIFGYGIKSDHHDEH
jgi:thiosulfate reductase cytochrome b subunit